MKMNYMLWILFGLGLIWYFFIYKKTVIPSNIISSNKTIISTSLS